jgi:hypothetical protein
MEFKGTSGKWRAINLCGRYVVGNDENSTLHFIDCWLEGIGGIATNKEAKANVLLISKAPEMLEMLKEYVRLLDGEFSPKTFISELVEKTEILIKEATEL